MAIAYVICAAGEGLRTRVIHPDIPKPLLLLNGKTLLEHSIRSLSLAKEDLLFIVGQEKDELQRAESELQSLGAFAPSQLHWLQLAKNTQGQLITAQLAAERIPASHSLAIFNADSAFSEGPLTRLMQQSAWEGLIPCSVEAGDSWSFCKVGPSSGGSEPVLEITEVAEKKRISDWCSVGFYFFRSRTLFERFAEEETAGRRDQEFFVAPVYNRYLRESHPIGLLPIENFKAMGTLEQIQAYWHLSLQDMQKQNRANPYARRAKAS